MVRLRAEGRYLGTLLARPVCVVLLVLTLLGVGAAYQVRPAYDIDVGGAADAPYVQNFLERRDDPAAGRTYRLSDAHSYVSLPGVGGGVPYSLTVTLNPGRANLPVTILVNGTVLLQRDLPDGWQSFTFSVDGSHPQAQDSRDLLVEVRVPAGRRLLLDRVQVGPGGAGLVVPAYSQVLYVLAAVLLVYLLAGRVGYRRDEQAEGSWQRAVTRDEGRGTRDAVPAVHATLLAGAGAALALVGGLAFARLPLTVYTGYLAGALLGAHLLLAPLWPLLRRLAPEARILGRLLARPLVWAIVALTLLGAVAAYQVRHAYDIDVGSPADQAYVRNFHDREAADSGGPTFRRGDTYSFLVLPGLGGGAPYSVTLTLQPGRPDVPVTVIINGQTFLQQPLPAQWARYTFAVDATHPQAFASRDLVVELRVPATFDLLLDRMEVSPAGIGFIAPAYLQLAYLGALVVLVYLLLGRLLAERAEGRGQRADEDEAHVSRFTFHVSRFTPRFALVPPLGAALTGAIAVGLLATVHLPFTVAAGHLMTTGVLTYGLLIGAEALAWRIAPGAPGCARLVAGLVAGAFAVRYGLMALPEAVIIDMPYHMKWVRELLAGNVAALTDPHGGLNQPPREWGLAVIIPKSPLFYFLAAPLAWLPGDLEAAVKGLVCLLEASTVLFCYGLLARFAPRLGGPRAGVWAGLVYAANPLGFRALAYGILPTILAQWLSVAFFALLLTWVSGRLAAAPPDRRARITNAGALGLLVILLTAALIAFPTIAVFNTLVIGWLVIVWARRRYRRVGWMVAGLLTGAWAVAVGVYYGVYISDLLTVTLPQMLGPRPAGSAAPAAETVHWSGPLDLLGWTLDYLTSPLPLLMGAAGLAVLWGLARRAVRGGAPQPEMLLAALTAGWAAILPVFLVANYRVDMIGKHLFYTMVPLALGGGIFLQLLWRRGGWGRGAAGLLAGALAIGGLLFWLERLIRASA